MKRVLTVDESMRIYSLLGILDGKTDFEDFGLEQCQVSTLPDLLNIFHSDKEIPVFELTIGYYDEYFNYIDDWVSTIIKYDGNVKEYYTQTAKEPIDAVYKLLCEYLEDKNNKKKAK